MERANAVDVESLQAHASQFSLGEVLGKGGCLVHAGHFRPSDGRERIAVRSRISEVRRTSWRRRCALTLRQMRHHQKARRDFGAGARPARRATGQEMVTSLTSEPNYIAMEPALGAVSPSGKRHVDFGEWVSDWCVGTGPLTQRNKLLFLHRVASSMRKLAASNIVHGDLDLGQLLCMGAAAEALAAASSTSEQAALEIAATKITDFGSGGEATWHGALTVAALAH